LSHFLYEKLGKPDTCPHGNPFPGAKNESELINSPRLSTAVKDEKLTVVRITEEGESTEGLLLFCYENALKPGCRIEVLRSDELSVLVKSEEGLIIEISAAFAKYICCVLQ